MRASILALVLLTVPGLALAQDPPVAANGSVLPEMIIVGRPQRPHAFVMLPRARVHFDRADASHHAVDRIVESVTHTPF